MRWIFPLIANVLLLPATCAAETRSCERIEQIQVAVEDDARRAVICEAASRALAFLDRYGLRLRRAISVTQVDQPIAVNGNAAYASYDSRSNAIRLMSYEAIFRHADDPRMYDQPFDRNHYAGVVAHEVAHAVMHHNSSARHMYAPPHEYLAHATQLAVMPEAARAELMRRKKVLPWESGDAISDAYLGADAGKFAVKSYLHLTSRKNPSVLVQQLLKAQGFSFVVPADAD